MLRYLTHNTKIKIKENKNAILLGILAFLALSIAFAAGYIVARDLTVTPIVIQQHIAE
jgi:hypothetical protein